MAPRLYWIFAFTLLTLSHTASGAYLIHKRPLNGIKILEQHKHLPWLYFSASNFRKVEACLKNPEKNGAQWHDEYSLSCRETVTHLTAAWIYSIKQLSRILADREKPVLSVILVNDLFKKVTGFERNDPALSPLGLSGNLLPVKDFAVMNDHRKLYREVIRKHPNLPSDPYAFVCTEVEVVQNIPTKKMNELLQESKKETNQLLKKIDTLKIHLKPEQEGDGSLSDSEDMLNKIFGSKLADYLNSVVPGGSCGFQDNYPDFDQLGKDLDNRLQSSTVRQSPLTVGKVYKSFATIGLTHNHYLGLRPVTYGRHATETEQLMEELLKKHNNALKKAHSEDDIIKVASNLSWEFINLHLLPDANGRVARLLSSYVLLAYGLNPPVFLSDRAVQTTKSQWLKLFREGIQKAQKGDLAEKISATLSTEARKIQQATLGHRLKRRSEL
jgi:hypothetical protein